MMRLDLGGDGAEFFLVHAAAVSGPRQPRKSQVRRRCYLALFVLDTMAVACAFVVPILIDRGVGAYRALETHVALSIAAVFAVLAISDRSLYGITLFRDWPLTARRAAAALAIATTPFLGAALGAGAPEWTMLAIGLVLAGLALPLLHFAAHILAMRLTDDQPLAEMVLWDHPGDDAQRPADAISPAALGLRLDLDDPLSLDRFGRLVVGADRVIVACPPERRTLWASVLRGVGVRGEILAPELVGLDPLGSGSHGDTPTLVVSTVPLDARSRAAKRLFDLTMGLASLLVALPLIAIVALAIRLDDGGPVLFVQPRLGRGNRVFMIYKFRSMQAGHCDTAGHDSVRRGDPRITRIGRLIRFASIDELPQLLNVLKGDMSLVGPRPHALESRAGAMLFRDVDARYGQRHAVDPGMTGLAQVRGFRGTTRCEADLASRLQCDLDYAKGWSIWRDVAILLTTPRVLLHRDAC